VNSSDERDAGRKRRRDFEQNRDVILSAADEAFAELGMSTSINIVAKRAGVAPATVYRHFPNKNALVDAVFDLRVAVYANAIENAQATPDPEQAFRKTIHAIVTLQSGDRSFREIVATREVDLRTDPGFVRFGTAFLGAIASARVAGVIRDDVDDTDVMLLLISTEGVARPTANQSPAALNRLVDLMLDGLCNHRTKLEGAALEFEQVLDVSRS
jgi:AcrR family transcriptional regulator